MVAIRGGSAIPLCDPTVGRGIRRPLRERRSGARFRVPAEPSVESGHGSRTADRHRRPSGAGRRCRSPRPCARDLLARDLRPPDQQGRARERLAPAPRRAVDPLGRSGPRVPHVSPRSSTARSSASPARARRATRTPRACASSTSSTCSTRSRHRHRPAAVRRRRRPDESVYLWVADDNPRAHRFYARNGFQLDGATHTERCHVRLAARRSRRPVPKRWRSRRPPTPTASSPTKRWRSVCTSCATSRSRWTPPRRPVRWSWRRERGLVLSPYQNRRWDSDFLTLRHLVESGRLGRVARFESRFERFYARSVVRSRPVAARCSTSGAT